MRHFKAGLELEVEVSRELDSLGIAHRRTQHMGKEDTEDRVDLIIPSSLGRRAMEFQITLRAKHASKIFTFALRALTTRARGVRIYLEVVGARRKDDIALIATKVARAIQTIARKFRDFGEHLLLGVRVNAKNAAIEKFDLVDFCGNRLLEAADKFWTRVEELRQASERRVAHNHAILSFLVSRVVPIPRNHVTPPSVSRVNTRSHFMPRRFCY